MTNKQYQIKCADEECAELNQVETIHSSFTCKKCGVFNLVVEAENKEDAYNVYDTEGNLLSQDNKE